MPVVTPPGAEPVGPITDYGSLQEAQVTEGVLRDAVDTVQVYSIAPSFSRAGEQAAVERVGSDRLRLTVSARGIPVRASGTSRSLSHQGSEPEVKITRTYRKEKDKYVLEEVLTTSETKTDKATTKSKQTFRVTQVKWYENKENDKARKEKREKARASLGAPSQPSFNHTCEDGGLFDEYGNSCEPPPPPPAWRGSLSRHGRRAQRGVPARL
jgi:hypothetical protein